MTGTQDARTARTERSSAARPILISTAILGGIILAGVGSTAAIAAVANGSGVETARETAPVDGVTALDLEVSAADFTVEYDDVAEATLRTAGGRAGDWTLERDGDELVVSSPGNRFDLCFAWCGWEKRSAVLTLPAELEDRGIEADVSLGAGTLFVRGDFGSLDLEMGAGDADVTGAIGSFQLDLGAGDFTGELADVREADFQVSAGSAEARLTGSAPKRLELDVAAGDLTLTLPDETYAVQSRVAAGDFANELRVDPSSPRVIDAEVSAGDLTLRPGK